MKIPKTITSYLVVLMTFWFSYPIGLLGYENKRMEELKSLIKNSTLIVVAEILKIEEAPGFWSGGSVTATQKVKYEILNILMGSYEDDCIYVMHDIYMTNPDVDRNKACLSEKLFKSGNTMILFIKRRDNVYWSLDNTLLGTKANVELINSIIASSED